MQQNSASYIVGFAAAVCLVCSLLVSTAAVLLKERQVDNVLLDRQKKILSVSGLIEPKQDISREEVNALFAARIEAHVIELKSGLEDESAGLDPATYDPQRALSDPAMSIAMPKNRAQVARVPKYSTVYEVRDEEGAVTLRVIPVEGKGLWSTLYGFLALAPDSNTIEGLTFYKHGETPGLGGEVDNPLWKSKWPGRKAYDESGAPAIQVIKGAAPGPEEEPHKVDGLSGATITANGVTHLLQFWLGEDGFGPYLRNVKAEGSAA